MGKRDEIDIDRYLTALRLRRAGKTLQEAGSVLGVTRERCRQMILKAERMIRSGEWQDPD